MAPPWVLTMNKPLQYKLYCRNIAPCVINMYMLYI